MTGATPSEADADAPRPHFGFTRHGRAVHARTIDHLPAHNGYARLNRWLAIRVTNGVGSMTCAYIFALIALAGLPQAIQQSFQGGHFSPLPLVQWIAQTFLQLVLLSVIMVGQNVQQVASDARAAKTFEDAELIVDRLDANTEGGLADVLAAVHAAITMTGHVLTAVEPKGQEAAGVAVVSRQDAPGAGDGSDPVDPGVGQPPQAPAPHRREDSRADEGTPGRKGQ